MFRKLQSANVVLIIASLLIAYFIWLIAKTGNVEEQVLENVPILLGTPPDIEAELSRKTVNVVVRYPTSARSKVYSSAFQVVNNNPGLFSQAGVREAQEVPVPLTTDDVQHGSIPENVEAQRVEPASIKVWIKYRVVPAQILPQITGQPGEGFDYEKALVSPADRLLTGPQDRLNSLPRLRNGVVELQTSPIPITDRRESFTTSVAILVPDQVSIVDEDSRKRLPREVSFAVVQVIIKEQATSRTIANIPIQVPTVIRNLVARTEPTSGTVTITGPRSRVESLDPRVIFLRLKNPPPEKPGVMGKVAIEARLDESVSPDIKIIAVRPQEVHLRYELIPPAETAPTTATTSL